MQGMKGYTVPAYIPPVIITAPLHTMGELRGGEGEGQGVLESGGDQGRGEGQGGEGFGEGQRQGGEREGEQLEEGQEQGQEVLVADGLGGFVAVAVDTDGDDGLIQEEDDGRYRKLASCYCGESVLPERAAG